MGWGESGVLTDAFAAFGNSILDIVGFADAVAVFGNVMFEISGFTDAIPDISSVATQESLL